MPTIILPVEVPAEVNQATLPTLLVVSQEAMSTALVSTLGQTIPALLLLVHSSSEAMELIEAIKPDMFVLDLALPDMDGIDLYEKLHAQPGFTGIPALLLGILAPERSLPWGKHGLMHLPFPVEPQALRFTLEALLNAPGVPVTSMSGRKTRKAKMHQRLSFSSEARRNSNVRKGKANEKRYLKEL